MSLLCYGEVLYFFSSRPFDLITVHVVLAPRGIAPTFLKFDSWSPGADFIPIISTKAIKQIKK